MTEKKLVVPLNAYLSTGIHIGMKQRIKPMEKYIYKIRPDKLAVFDIQKINEKIKIAIKMLSEYDPKDIIIVSRKKNAHKSVVKFAEAVKGATAVHGRFMPGMLTNPNYERYCEPKIMVVTDPFSDKQAVEEAVKANIPVIGLCDTYNSPKYLDLVVPLNNKGRKSVALFYWILAREFLKERKIIKGDAEFKFSVEDFEMPKEAEEEEQK